MCTVLAENGLPNQENLIKMKILWFLALFGLTYYFLDDMRASSVA